MKYLDTAAPPKPTDPPLSSDKNTSPGDKGKNKVKQKPIP